jgi:hypothetical protein
MQTLSSFLLSKNVKIQIYRITVLLTVWYGSETQSLKLRENHILCLDGNSNKKLEKYIRRSFMVCNCHQIFFLSEASPLCTFWYWVWWASGTLPKEQGSSNQVQNRGHKGPVLRPR